MGVVVVTGGTSGVGRATCRELAERGHAVAVLARGTRALKETRRELERLGERPVLALSLDIADAEAVESAAARVEAELGEIDAWVSNAMATIFAEFLDIEPDEYRRATEVTYLGSVWGARAALRRMVPRNRGTLVQVGSALGHRGIPFQAPYCGAKHAVQGFLDSVRSELRHHGSSVRVTTVTLPALNTPQFDHGRTKMPRRPRPVAPIYQPEVGAQAIVAAIEDPRREVWVGAPVVATVLASRVAGAAVDRYLGRTGFDAQQDPETERRTVDNLFSPLDRDPGAHGRFDVEALNNSAYAAAVRHRRPMLAGTAIIGLAYGVTRLRARR
jgi:NAD(P)-dependent dehydrogenase (short-subunit alcohol dehydrogenase family)